MKFHRDVEEELQEGGYKFKFNIPDMKYVSEMKINEIKSTGIMSTCNNAGKNGVEI